MFSLEMFDEQCFIFAWIYILKTALSINKCTLESSKNDKTINLRQRMSTFCTVYSNAPYTENVAEYNRICIVQKVFYIKLH